MSYGLKYFTYRSVIVCKLPFSRSKDTMCLAEGKFLILDLREYDTIQNIKDKILYYVLYQPKFNDYGTNNISCARTCGET